MEFVHIAIVRRSCCKYFQGKTAFVLWICLAFIVTIGLLYFVTDSFSNFLDNIYSNKVTWKPRWNRFNSNDTNSGMPMKMVCYCSCLGNDSALLPEDIPVDLCTHINIAFAGINQSDYSLEISSFGGERIQNLSSLKLRNNELKLIISVGGAGCQGFSSMVQNHFNRKRFINSTMRFIKKYNLDGVDIDWEWPADDGNVSEKVKFIQLLQEFKEEFDKHRKHYILSIAAGTSISQIQMSYYVSYIIQYVDYINLMTYDYHFYTAYYPLTDYNAPLYPSVKDKNSVFSSLNINYSVNYWISLSAPRKQLILGIPSFGHSYRLISSLNHELHAPASGFGSVGENGFVSYPEVCNFLKLLDTFQVYDDDSKVPYAYNHYDWLSYDNEKSIAIKAEFIVKEKLGGAMVFSLNTEDFNGTCSQGKIKYPLIKTIRSVINSLASGTDSSKV